MQRYRASKVWTSKPSLFHSENKSQFVSAMHMYTLPFVYLIHLHLISCAPKCRCTLAVSEPFLIQSSEVCWNLAFRETLSFPEWCLWLALQSQTELELGRTHRACWQSCPQYHLEQSCGRICGLFPPYPCPHHAQQIAGLHFPGSCAAWYSHITEFQPRECRCK